MRTITPVFLLLVALPAPALADELELIGRHVLEGRQAGRAFTGTVEIRPDATYAGERRFADGSVERLAGRASIDQKALVLRPAGAGLSGALLGAAIAEARRYGRDDDGRVVRWRFASGADHELIRQPEEAETKLGLVGRLLRRPVLCWLFNDNRGVVDGARGLEVYRSKQPSPADVVEWVERRGVRTVLSLNGDLDEEATYREERVTLGEFVAARANHETVAMSASRAPSDEELVRVFRVLLDDSRRPILLHCRGGSDRTGIIAALYEVEFLGVSKHDAKKRMRRHLWMANEGTEIQGAYLDLYQPGTLRRLLERHGVAIPARFAR